MIATVTLNPSWDTVVVVDDLRIGEVNRSCREFSYAGGKGIDVARTVHRLDGQTCALGILAGPNGQRLAASLSSEGIPHDFVEAEGDTRANVLLENRRTCEETIIQHESNVIVGEAQLAALTEKIDHYARRSEVMVFGGRVPGTLSISIYADLIGLARQVGCRTILDASGDALRHGIQARPYMIKPNRSEMEELLDGQGRQLGSLEDVMGALRSAPVADIEVVVVSLGDQGCVVRAEGVIWVVAPIRAEAVSYAGAGDCLVGGIALGLSKGETIRRAVAMGVAAATATLSQYGSCFFRLEDYRSNISKVRIREVPHAVP